MNATKIIFRFNSEFYIIISTNSDPDEEPELELYQNEYNSSSGEPSSSLCDIVNGAMSIAENTHVKSVSLHLAWMQVLRISSNG